MLHINLSFSLIAKVFSFKSKFKHGFLKILIIFVYNFCEYISGFPDSGWMFAVHFHFMYWCIYQIHKHDTRGKPSCLLLYSSFRVWIFWVYSTVKTFKVDASLAKKSIYSRNISFFHCVSLNGFSKLPEMVRRQEMAKDVRFSRWISFIEEMKLTLLFLENVSWK